MPDQLHPIINNGGLPVSLLNALKPGDEIRSFNATFQLSLQSSDGNLVLSIADPAGNPNFGLINRPIWAAYTQNKGAAYAIMQQDGNFVVYDGSKNPLWWPKGMPLHSGAFIILQDDGNLVVYAPDKRTPLWASSTSAAEAPGANAQ
jgi:hypothetical protein